MENTAFIKERFKGMFESSDLNENFIHKIVDQSYIQHVDGETLGFDGFVKHLKALKEKTKSIEIDFKTLIGEGEVVFSNHVVTATMKNETKVVIHVIAEFRVKDRKMYYCDELTSLIDGASANRNLGSIP